MQTIRLQNTAKTLFVFCYEKTKFIVPFERKFFFSFFWIKIELNMFLLKIFFKAYVPFSNLSEVLI